MKKTTATLVMIFSIAFLCASTGNSRQHLSSQEIKVADPLTCVRISTDTKGESHFDVIEIPFSLADFAPPAPPISVSEAFSADSTLFISSPSGWFGDWHPAPQRQFVICLKGELEVEVSDGERRRFGPGSIVLVEDTTGKGHISRVVGKERTHCMVITLK